MEIPIFYYFLTFVLMYFVFLFFHWLFGLIEYHLIRPLQCKLRKTSKKKLTRRCPYIRCPKYFECAAARRSNEIKE